MRDSSLSACTQAVIAAEVGHLELAYDYFAEAALMDLADLEHNTGDGLHIASLAGAWIAAVCGFGGLRDHSGELAFAPRLPPNLSRLVFRVGWRGRRLRVEVRDSEASTRCTTARSRSSCVHYGERVTVEPGKTLRLDVPKAPARTEPKQPPGRAPRRRRSS